MRFLSELEPRSFPTLGLGFALVLLLAVACGTSSSATPAAPPADTSRATTAPTARAAVPTATPAVVGAPTAAAATVNPGKVTWMMTGFGTERFDPAQRVTAFNQVARRLNEENYDIGVGYINIPWAVAPRVQAWQPWPMAFYPSNLYGITLK